MCDNAIYAVAAYEEYRRLVFHTSQHDRKGCLIRHQESGFKGTSMYSYGVTSLAIVQVFDVYIADDRSRSVHFYESWELPAHVDWAAVTAATCLDNNVKARKAAEILVPRYIPSALITSVILYSHGALEYVQDRLCALAADNTDDDKRFARFMNMLRVCSDRFFPQYAGEH